MTLGFGQLSNRPISGDVSENVVAQIVRILCRVSRTIGIAAVYDRAAMGIKAVSNRTIRILATWGGD